MTRPAAFREEKFKDEEEPQISQKDIDSDKRITRKNEG